MKQHNIYPMRPIKCALHTIPFTALIFFYFLTSSIFFSAYSQIRVSQIGSNPMLSSDLFPQDMQAWPMRGLSYSPGYAKEPFWGRIDNPLSRPNGNYTSTGLSTDGFSHTAKIYSVTNDISYDHSFSPTLMIFSGLNLDFDIRNNEASGLLHDKDTVAPHAPIPFKYNMNHTLTTGNFTAAGAFTLLGIPTGLRLQFGIQNTAALSHSLTFTKDNTAYNSDRATWGWTTSPCAHVFGIKGPEGDTWLQNDYAIGPLYTFDAQAGATLPFGKAGLHVNFINGYQDYFVWHTDSNNFGNDSIINRNFIGHYEKQDWSRTTSGFTTQLFSNYILRKHDNSALNVFGRITYSGLTSGEALSGNLDIARGNKQSVDGGVLDIAPNVTLPFGSIFSYIDVAIPLQYGYTHKGNTYLRWVGGGQLRTFWDTHTSYDDENIWEPFSYADQHDIGIGIDFSTMFPLINQPALQVGLGINLLINACATFTYKNYGTNTDNGSNVNFAVQQKRYDYEGRKQFASGVKLQCRRGRSMAWLEVIEPMLQAVRPVTKVSDASNIVRFDHEKEPLWLSMQGMRFSIFYTYEMTIPWVAQFNAK